MKKALCILLAILFLLSGCTIRQGPPPYLTVELPAAKETETNPVPSPAPTPEPAPEPTPCPHENWADGICSSCGFVCPHENWNDGICALCGTVCRHLSHNPETLLCTCCSKPVRHTYFDSICSRCGRAPVFSDDEVPEEFRQKCTHPGTVEHVQYETQEYFGVAPGVELKYNKRLSVYLPYGYDPSKQYDVVITLHGMGCLETYWLDEEQFYDHEDTKVYTVDMLDNMIERGLIPPIIVCSPTFYKDQVVQLGYVNASLFATELRNDLLPFILENYATYAEEPTLESAAKVREHFAFVGLSMGSMIGFQSALSLCLDVFGYFGLYSGCNTYPENILPNINKEEFKDLPILYMFNCAGQWDVALNEHKYYYQDLVNKTDRLTDGINANFVTVLDYGHEFRTWLVGLYDSLQMFFSYTDGIPPEE